MRRKIPRIAICARRASNECQRGKDELRSLREFYFANMVTSEMMNFPQLTKKSIAKRSRLFTCSVGNRIWCLDCRTYHQSKRFSLTVAPHSGELLAV